MATKKVDGMRRIVPLVALVAALTPSARASDVTPGMDPAAPLVLGVYPHDFTLGKYAGLRASPMLGMDEKLALARTIAPGPFLVHTYAQWNAGLSPVEAIATEARAAAERYGLLYNVALKFVPPPGHESDVDGFAAWVADAVRVLAPDTGVVHFQITNEANIGFSSDSDGYYGSAARQALIHGVIAAASAKEAGQAVGFNWFYRWLPQEDAAFFDELGAAPQAFRDGVDWVGEDVYPGTYWPPPGSDPYSSVVDAVRYLSRDLMPRAGLAGKPIFVQETGWPDVDVSAVATPVGPLPYPEGLQTQPRSERAQADAARAIVNALRTTHCTDNVRAGMWFPLLDAPGAADGWGLAREDGSPKPAFHAFADAVRASAADRCP